MSNTASFGACNLLSSNVFSLMATATASILTNDSNETLRIVGNDPIHDVVLPNAAIHDCLGPAAG